MHPLSNFATNKREILTFPDGAKGYIATTAGNIPPLQPRPPTTGCEEVLPLQPRLLPAFDRQVSRETRSEPRDIPPSSRMTFDYQPTKAIEAELGLASVPAMAIGSSTEVLVSIVENQAGLRRNSCLAPRLPVVAGKSDAEAANEANSPQDCEFVRSPSTELTSPSGTSLPKDVSCSSLEHDEKTKDCDNCNGSDMISNYI